MLTINKTSENWTDAFDTVLGIQLKNKKPTGAKHSGNSIYQNNADQALEEFVSSGDICEYIEEILASTWGGMCRHHLCGELAVRADE